MANKKVDYTFLQSNRGGFEMKYTIIELDTDKMEFIKKFCDALKTGLAIVPAGIFKITQFETQEDLK